MSLSRRQFGNGLCALTALMLTRTVWGVDAPASWSKDFIQPGYQPIDDDENGLWAVMDHAENDIKASRFLVRDSEVNNYIHSIVCNLANQYCPDVRSYVLRTPHFNASMAPNGMMQVWTGLLLRCRDEAQIAAILGHETGHYLRQHTVQVWRNVRSKSNFSAFLGLALGAAGVGILGSATDLALVASIYSFSRDQEREADEIGLHLMAKAGYAPSAAPEVWDQLLAEFKGSTAERDKSVLFATHPLPEERLATLKQQADALGGNNGARGKEAYNSKLAAIRPMLIADELALRQYGRSEIVFDRLLADSPNDGQLWYAKGELYRFRNGDGDAERALSAYARSLQSGNAPGEVHRSIMLEELRVGSRERAKEALDAYAKFKPDAADLEMLNSLLQ
ncbi:MAG TPA: M48 family metalloprotease [Burkholderiales bacterium]|nr:M48 family metalloprotease [Burkholderiales bacterium]